MINRKLNINKKYNWDVPQADVYEFSKKQKDYAICVPIINEGIRFVKLLKKLSKYSVYADILVLDGDSTDDSINLDYLKYSKVRTLLVKKDIGKLSSQLRMGYAYALLQCYKGVITIDGNNKDDPRSIPAFVKLLNGGYDFVQGSRFIEGGQEKNTPLLRYVAIRFIHAPILSIFSGFKYTDTTSGFRAYSRKLLLNKDLNIFRRIFISYELLAYISFRAPKMGFCVVESPITRVYPNSGKIPTKIHKLSGYVDLLKTLVDTVLGKFNVRYLF